MAGLQIDIDVDGVIAALNGLGDAAKPYINTAAQETGESIVREARARLKRQVGPQATGKTEQSIVTRPAYDGNGFIVIVEREPFPELPLWLEKGTKPGKRPNRARTHARPFFYVSAELEEGPHFRRIEGALQDAIAEKGLGE